MKNRSRIHMLYTAAARLERDGVNPVLIGDLRKAAQHHATRKADGVGWTEEEDIRVEKQRGLFGMLPSANPVDRLKEGMMQRAYDLLWDGNCDGCDAILEFLPSKDADVVLNAYSHDQDGGKPPSRFH